MTRAKRWLTLTVAVAFVAALTSCQKPATPTNTPANNANVVATNVATTPATASDVPVSSDSPGAAYKAAHAARKAGDVAALKKLLSKDILEFFQIMTEDGKSLDEMLKELTQQPQAEKAEVRNEKINGNKATIEYLDEDGEWRPMDLVREDGMWKLTIDAGDAELEGKEAPRKGKK